MKPIPPRSLPSIAHGLFSRAALAVLLASVLTAHVACGQTVPVPNGDFATPSAQANNPQVVPGPATDWNATPTYASAPGSVGVFYNSYPFITNLDANQQVGYIFSIPTLGLYQDLSAQYTIGTSYTMTVGIIGGDPNPNVNFPMTTGDTIDLILYYRTGSNNTGPMVTLGDTTVTYGTAPGDLQPEFGADGTNFLQNFSVSIPAVQSGDPEVGKNIGVEMEATNGTGESYFDVGNVTLAPEPGTAGLLAFGLGALMLRRRRPAC